MKPSYHVLDTPPINASNSRMSHGHFPKLLLVSAALLAGCAAPAAPDETADVGTSDSALGEAGTLTFGADFKVQATGTFEKGKKVRVLYDVNRLTACRGDFNGKPGWSITGFWRIGAADVHAFDAGGFSASGAAGPPVLALDQPGDLQIWFQNNSRWGCNAYDSDFGKNYHFVVSPAATEPGWVGSVRSIISRQTCDGGVGCESDLRDVNGEILFGTWARQRAAIRKIYFEVYKDGVTTSDDPDLWKKLDVQVHSRMGSSGAFTTAYVGFDHRTGNNARYAIDLNAMDPIKGSFTIQNKSDCPAFPLRVPAEAGGTYVEATMDLYFTINGVELRPAPGAAYRVRYQNYKDLYKPCL